LTKRSVKKMSPKTPAQFKEIRKDKKELILKVALELFATQGYHATSINNIAQKALISKGLLYNYFKSKAQLITEIVEKSSIEMLDILNPNNDDEISNEEMDGFFEKCLFSLKENAFFWKLYFQMSLQKDILPILLSASNTDKNKNTQQLLIKYFTERFENPETSLFLFSSTLKGIAFQLALAPDRFSDDLLKKTIAHLKHKYVIPKKNK